MKILVTGGTGFIGKNVIRRLLENNCEIHCVIRKKSITFDDDRIKYYIDDNSSTGLENYFCENKFDGVIHLASCFLAQHSAEDVPDLINSNLLFATRILESAVNNKVKWFVNTGTFWQNYQDNDYCPVNLYAATKQAFQVISQYYIETSSIKFVTIKLNDTYGPGDTRRKIFNLWNTINQTNEKLLMSPGDQIIDIVFIDDVVSAYMRLIDLLQLDSNSIINGSEYAVSSSKRYSLRNLAKVFESVAGKQLPIVWGGREYRKREVMNPWTKGRPVPGWRAKVSLEEGIKKVIEDES